MRKPAAPAKTAEIRAFSAGAREARREHEKRYRSLLRAITDALEAGPRAFVALWRAVGCVLDERLWRFDSESVAQWLETHVRTSRTRAYAKVKLARFIDQPLLDACGESVLAAAIALIEARRGRALLATDRVKLERVEIDGEKRPLRELTVAVIQGEIARVRGRSAHESLAVQRLRAAIEEQSALSGTKVRALGGRVAITSVPEEQLRALAAALTTATRG